MGASRCDCQNDRGPTRYTCPPTSTRECVEGSSGAPSSERTSTVAYASRPLRATAKGSPSPIARNSTSCTPGHGCANACRTRLRYPTRFEWHQLVGPRLAQARADLAHPPRIEVAFACLRPAIRTPSRRPARRRRCAEVLGHERGFPLDLSASDERAGGHTRHNHRDARKGTAAHAIGAGLENLDGLAALELRRRLGDLHAHEFTEAVSCAQR